MVFFVVRAGCKCYFKLVIKETSNKWERHIFLTEFVCFPPRLLGNSTHTEQIKCILLCTGHYVYFPQIPFYYGSLRVIAGNRNFRQNVLLRLKCILIEVSSPHLCLFRSTILIILWVPKQSTKPDTSRIKSVRPTNLKLVSRKRLEETISHQVICFEEGSPTMWQGRDWWKIRQLWTNPNPCCVSANHQ